MTFKFYISFIQFQDNQEDHKEKKIICWKQVKYWSFLLNRKFKFEISNTNETNYLGQSNATSHEVQ